MDLPCSCIAFYAGCDHHHQRSFSGRAHEQKNNNISIHSSCLFREHQNKINYNVIRSRNVALDHSPSRRHRDDHDDRRTNLRDQTTDSLLLHCPFPPTITVPSFAPFSQRITRWFITHLPHKHVHIHPPTLLEDKTIVSDPLLVPFPPATTMPSVAPFIHFITRWLSCPICRESTDHRRRDEWACWVDDDLLLRLWLPATTVPFLSPPLSYRLTSCFFQSLT